MHPRNMSCFSYVIVNTLHKVDNKDDDDDDNNNIHIFKHMFLGNADLTIKLSVSLLPF